MEDVKNQKLVEYRSELIGRIVFSFTSKLLLDQVFLLAFLTFTVAIAVLVFVLTAGSTSVAVTVAAWVVIFLFLVLLIFELPLGFLELTLLSLVPGRFFCTDAFVTIDVVLLRASGFRQAGVLKPVGLHVGVNARKVSLINHGKLKLLRVLFGINTSGDVQVKGPLQDRSIRGRLNIFKRKKQEWLFVAEKNPGRKEEKITCVKNM